MSSIGASRLISLVYTILCMLIIYLATLMLWWSIVPIFLSILLMLLFVLLSCCFLDFCVWCLPCNCLCCCQYCRPCWYPYRSLAHDLFLVSQAGEFTPVSRPWAAGENLTRSLLWPSLFMKVKTLLLSDFCFVNLLAPYLVCIREKSRWK